MAQHDFLNGSVTLAVLTGGKSSRMGRDKAGIVYHGHTFAERILRELCPGQGGLAGEIIFAGDNAPVFAEKLDWPIVCVPDRYKDIGSLGGIEAALAGARFETVLIAACDMPLVTRATAKTMLDWLGAHDAVVPVVSGTKQVLFSLYSRRCLPVVRRNIAMRQYRLTDVIDRVDSVFLHEADFASDIRRQFTNVNTPEDLETL